MSSLGKKKKGERITTMDDDLVASVKRPKNEREIMARDKKRHSPPKAPSCSSWSASCPTETPAAAGAAWTTACPPPTSSSPAAPPRSSAGTASWTPVWEVATEEAGRPQCVGPPRPRRGGSLASGGCARGEEARTRAGRCL